MTEGRDVCLPAQLALDGKVLGNPVRQLRRPEIRCRAEVQRYPKGRDRWLVIRDDGTRTLVVPRRITPTTDVDEVLLIPDGYVPVDEATLRNFGGRARWLKPTPFAVEEMAPEERDGRCSLVLASWRDQFHYRNERRENGEVVERGLRTPQRGALHAALAHWSICEDAATIVMPTGTGKTETMLALLVDQRLERLLIVVPTAALREQTAAKFERLGVLVGAGVIGSGALYPVVGTLEHRPRTPGEVEEYFRCCNVVVTTMGVISGCNDDVQRKMAEMCSHLFIDEAHHIQAPTWEKFRRFFTNKAVLQFTATPFRGDGRHVDGEIIYNYPLRKAQAEGYFRPIDFLSVRQYRSDRADEEIARAAVEQLEQDLKRGLNHVVMARTSSIARAEKVHEIYRRVTTAHNPLLVHSEMSSREKREALRKFRGGESRIVVCVNMLGEGFDLPELKIAALHDAHKSLAVTLQFIGRFTRARDDIGDAVVVANVADVKIAESLRQLYAEDTDWNLLLPTLSEGATGREVQRAEFLGGFADAPTEIPLQNIFPKMSTVVYRTNCADWRPDEVEEMIDEARLYYGPTVNHDRKVLLFVTHEREPVPWGFIRGIHNTIWDLYLLHWDSKRNLLFINSSNNGSLHEDLAKAVAGDDVERIRGEAVFRTLHGIDRLILMNLGLNSSLSRAVRFTMHAGANIREGLAEAHLQNKYKSNLFGRGFENGEKASMGCSYKGRIWSHRAAKDVSEWVEWCHDVGEKLLDETISVEGILEHVLIPEEIGERPPLVPLAIDWPDEFLQRSEEVIEVDVAGEVVPFYEAGIELMNHEPQGSLRFRVFTEDNSVEYEMRFTEEGVQYVPVAEDAVEIVVSRKRQGLPERFREEYPIVWFENGALLLHDLLLPPSAGDRVPFNRERIEAWDWTGIDLKKESQRTEKRSDSIQYRVIQELLREDQDPDYDIVFDDDDTREAADVVVIKVEGERLIVHLFHCKYSSEDDPGARVNDLYAVCGQAQRSVFWRGDVQRLFAHLRRREEARLRRHDVSRFERGDFALLDGISRGAPFLTPEFKISIVQPGLSKSEASVDQLDLLAVTELYLRETHAIEFGVIASV